MKRFYYRATFPLGCHQLPVIIVGLPPRRNKMQRLIFGHPGDQSAERNAMADYCVITARDFDLGWHADTASPTHRAHLVLQCGEY